jgi:hypothetical protein
MSQVLARLGCWISPCYTPFSLGARFETYEPFIYLIFNFFRAAVNRGYWISGYGGTTVYNELIICALIAYRKHGCSSLVFILCCVGSDLCDELIIR